MTTRSAPLALTALALAALAHGCGDYVEYKGGPPVSAPPTAGAEALDEETRRAWSTAERLDHAALEGLLARAVSVSEDGDFVYLDYEALDATPDARLLLAGYLAMLDAVDPDQLADPAERLAFWINAYNAHTIAAVVPLVLADPEFSVMDTGGRFFDEVRYRVGGLVVSLNHIEQGIIRGDFSHAGVSSADAALRSRMRELHAALWEGAVPDARIHVALNCASLGCPNLPGAAPFVFRGATLDAQLHAASVDFVHNRQKGAGPEGISQLFEWYAPDFEAGYGGARGFVAAHRADPDAVNYARNLPYDWSLNRPPR